MCQTRHHAHEPQTRSTVTAPSRITLDSGAYLQAQPPGGAGANRKADERGSIFLRVCVANCFYFAVNFSERLFFTKPQIAIFGCSKVQFNTSDTFREG